MIDPNFIILYVDNPLKSADFYRDLLGKEPIESSPTFTMFALNSGVMLGLWSRHTVEPAALFTGSGGEIAFSVPDKAMVDKLYTDWSSRRITIIQKPVAMDFGFTFVALDPDKHRLRVFTTTQE